jgi:RimJ/RimL family protein N-acetyltransferase
MVTVALPFDFTSPLVTERLTLRMMTEADTDAVHAYQSREDVCRYLLFGPRSRAEVKERLATHAQHTRLDRDGDYLQLAVERSSDGQVLGDLYFTIKNLEHSTGEIGWSFHPDYNGQGYATEGASRVLELAFDTLKLHRVIAELDPRNERSIALCRRLGMREEAHFVEDMWFKGEWADTGIYGLLAREFQSARTPPQPA